MIFNAPKNFKRGQYLFGRYRIPDVICLLSITIVSVISVVIFLNIFQSKSILVNLIVVIVFLLPIAVVYILYMPMPTYFNVLEYIKSFVYFHRKQKQFKWEGIHQFNKDDFEEAKYEEV